MEKFLECLRVEGCKYEIADGAVIVWSEFSPSLLTYAIVIPENTTFTDGLDLGWFDGEIQLPEDLKVAYIMDLINANVTRLPSNLTIYDGCSIYLDAHKIENVSYRDNCGTWERTIFAFWANDDFLIAAGCFAGTYSDFEKRVNYKYYRYNATAYQRQAQECISELAEKLGKPDPFKKATAK